WSLSAQEAWCIDNDDGGIAALLTQLRTRAPELVVLEATGGYETQAATALAAAGWRVAVVNPRQVRRFAQALNRLAKTDRIDAQVLADTVEKLISRSRKVTSPKFDLIRRPLLNATCLADGL